MSRRLLVLLLVVLSAGTGLRADAATGPVNLVVSGGPLEMSLTPGSPTSTTITVRNPASYEQAVELEVTGLDVSSGDYDFSGSAPSGFAVEISPARFALAGGASRQAIVTVRPSSRAPVGSSSLGLLVRGRPQAADGASPVLGEIGVPIFLSVPGQVDDSGRIESFKPASEVNEIGPLPWKIGFTNSGTIHYRVSGRIDLYRDGRQVDTLAIPSTLVLRDTTRGIEATWSGDGLSGPVVARAHLQWSRSRSAQAEAGAAFAAVITSGSNGAGQNRGLEALIPDQTKDVRAVALAALLLLAAMLVVLVLFLRREMEGDRQVELP